MTAISPRVSLLLNATTLQSFSFGECDTMPTAFDDEDEAALIAAAEQEGDSDSGQEQAQDEPPWDQVGDVLDPRADPRGDNSTATTTPTQSTSNRTSLKQSTLTFQQRQPQEYLVGLNTAQLAAVTADLGSLQILAGPGSGKTKVLTSRVAYLLQHYKIQPQHLVVSVLASALATHLAAVSPLNQFPRGHHRVTFTNKAANEMKTRLALLVGKETVDSIIIGTFVCVRYLRRYGRRIGIRNDFTVADRDDCLATARRAVVTAKCPENLRKELNPKYLLDVITKCKATGLSPRAYRAQGDSIDYFKAREKTDAIANIYQVYEDELGRDNALDFDDLLVRGSVPKTDSIDPKRAADLNLSSDMSSLELVRKHESIISDIQSVLIDEFQDTNAIQYDFVTTIARGCQSLTIVGDPDQSIYGWRNAEVGNLERMVKDFKPVKQIFLEENYRSTGAILGAALAVVRQGTETPFNRKMMGVTKLMGYVWEFSDANRIQKGLKATHGAGSSVVLHCASNAYEEASFIAAQIKHLVAHTGNLVDYGDVAILLRYGALSRNIEVALQKTGIPSRMVGGHKFFDRAEVKDIISYLQLVDNPSYTAAFVRVVNTPLRGIGDKTIRDIIAQARLKNLSAFELCKKLANGSGQVSLTSKQKNGMQFFVELILELQRKAHEGATVPDLIDALTASLNYQAHLEKSQGPDAKDRWENIEELKAFATVVAEEHPEGVDDLVLPEDEDFEEVAIPARGKAEDADDDASTSTRSAPVLTGTKTDNPLRTFLAVSMLATDSETNEVKENSKQRKVTLSTCHAAKGLEWPIIFVPACEDGTYPFYRCRKDDEIAEESPCPVYRRLLYVAITRAQGFCTLTHCQQRMAGADMVQRYLTPFLKSVVKTYPTLFVPKLQKIGADTRQAMAKVLGREPPDEAETARLIEEHNKTLPIDAPNESNHLENRAFASKMNQHSANMSAYNHVRASYSSTGPAPIPAGANAGFSSALSTFQNGPNGVGSSSVTKFGMISSVGYRTSAGPAMTKSSISKPLPATNIIRASSAGSSSSSTSSSVINSAAFKPPRPMAGRLSSAQGTISSRSAAASAHRNGPLEPPETRLSIISNAVLVGSDAEWKTKSVPTNLAERFVKGEGERLAQLRSLGLVSGETQPFKSASRTGTARAGAGEVSPKRRKV
ncbi:BZ3500_MvSof-1268-A1-R1_Chr3-3g06427 [Microbotryum saponariae]|uniref:DNA 3'-5' helicase n=1 Tax=Microbotryum saponariae TaxID=289078 RepID=A0A2X0LBR4_9BASI|nr:BZ3500_MvSof-1268-A1-R1_Chr3-3g06427 [Microbotryum saponariae]SDA04394.1 BZ3501_MvSof-1269-A2-R1_Chr3-2g06114 [Microbotryum saponariae]